MFWEQELADIFFDWTENWLVSTVPIFYLGLVSLSSIHVQLLILGRIRQNKLNFLICFFPMKQNRLLRTCLGKRHQLLDWEETLIKKWLFLVLDQGWTGIWTSFWAAWWRSTLFGRLPPKDNEGEVECLSFSDTMVASERLCTACWRNLAVKRKPGSPHI